MCARARIRCRESPEGNGSLLEDDGSRTEFEYDRQGNLLSERSGSGTTTYAYDTFNLTAKVEKPDGSYVRHEYDTEGLRSRICENGVTSRFVFDGWNMVNELDEEWNAKASYVRGHELLAQVDGQGDAYYYLNCISRTGWAASSTATSTTPSAIPYLLRRHPEPLPISGRAVDLVMQQ
ncbi:RHS repeat protein [Paenibacillus thiaminolyticus]|nr:RHS repeat protein [Paenibacillus thiaminolyticus]MDG0872231.1 RHS repeat protein [Paenibacillus thiaminolyticus]